MPYPLEWDTSTGEQKKMPALKVNPIPGVQAYDGYRNPLTRSSSASRVSMTFATPATKGQRKVYHFDGQREMAVGIEAILSPDLYGLEVQLPPVNYRIRKGKLREHSFDLALLSGTALGVQCMSAIVTASQERRPRKRLRRFSKPLRPALRTTKGS